MNVQTPDALAATQQRAFVSDSTIFPEKTAGRAEEPTVPTVGIYTSSNILADQSLFGKLMEQGIEAIDEAEKENKLKPKKPRGFRAEVEARLEADAESRLLVQKRQDTIEAETRSNAKEIQRLLGVEAKSKAQVEEIQKLREQQNTMVDEARANAKAMQALQESQKKFEADAQAKFQEQIKKGQAEAKVSFSHSSQ